MHIDTMASQQIRNYRKDKITEYLPDFLLNEACRPEIVPYAISLADKRGNLTPAESVALANGLCDLNEVAIQSQKWKDEGVKPSSEVRKTAWYSVNEVADVRVFFRQSNKEDGGTIGSKMRVYYEGYNREEGEEEGQSIDSGFINIGYNLYEGRMVFQRALALSVLYKALNCIGGPAIMRKLNVPAPKESGRSSYKELTAIKPKFDKDLDRRDFDHVLYAACLAAGAIDDEGLYFSNEFLDDFVEMLISSKNLDELKESMRTIGDIELMDDEIEDIIDKSNQWSADFLEVKKSKRKSEPEGINVVIALEYIKDILDAE